MSDLSLEEFSELKIAFSLSIGYNGGAVGDAYLSEYIGYDRWIELSEDEKEDAIYDFAKEWGNEYIELSGKVYK